MKANNSTCIYCNGQIEERTKGDHIIPQGLGKFHPARTIFLTCRSCDSKNGSRFERIFLRTGLIAVFRARKGLKSANNRKQPIHSPSLDIFGAIESKEFGISIPSKPNETIYVSRSGEVQYANRILITRHEKLIGEIKIPVTENIREICNFIESKLSCRSIDAQYDLNISDDLMPEVIKELKSRGMKFGDDRKLHADDNFEIMKITSTFTDNHFRFIGSTVVKAMIFLGYSTKLLEHLIKFVYKGDREGIFSTAIDAKESGIDAIDDPPLKEFYYSFEWVIHPTVIQISASILAHKNVNGIRMKISAKAGNDTSIIIPYGRVVAHYGETPEDGTLQIYHGDQLIQ